MAARQALQHTRLQAQGIPSRAVGAQGDFITGTTAKVGPSVIVEVLPSLLLVVSQIDDAGGHRLAL